MIPGLGRSPGEGNSYQLQHSSLENSMDSGAWWAPVHGVVKSPTWLSDFSRCVVVPHIFKSEILYFCWTSFPCAHLPYVYLWKESVWIFHSFNFNFFLLSSLYILDTNKPFVRNLIWKFLISICGSFLEKKNFFEENNQWTPTYQLFLLQTMLLLSYLGTIRLIQGYKDFSCVFS